MYKRRVLRPTNTRLSSIQNSRKYKSMKCTRYSNLCSHIKTTFNNSLCCKGFAVMRSISNEG
ncbi:hypothetical protein V1477_019756 [Vespula maculifrons]|uniref:Uncharacterized protein n=1 Tax=Vespula maculifrons TaxID=7453 RepID=A0ABD2ARN1_VESMC